MTRNITTLNLYDNLVWKILIEETTKEIDIQIINELRLAMGIHNKDGYYVSPKNT